MLPSPTNLSHHERAVLAKASEQVNSVCEREWISRLQRQDDEPPCKNEGFVVVGDRGECLRCGADQGEVCRS
jgi:hypothetical protein